MRQFRDKYDGRRIYNMESQARSFAVLVDVRSGNTKAVHVSALLTEYEELDPVPDQMEDALNA